MLRKRSTTRRARGGRRSATFCRRRGPRLSETRQIINLAAFGFNPQQFGFPAVVGPFNLFDARVAVSQPIVDIHAMNSLRAENHNIAAAQFNVKNARDLVVLVSANLYLQGLAGRARTESARAQMQTAEAVFQQASNMKENGLVAGIDVVARRRSAEHSTATGDGGTE